jgi:hypothetical protein
LDRGFCFFEQGAVEFLAKIMGFGNLDRAIAEFTKCLIGQFNGEQLAWRTKFLQN